MKKIKELPFEKSFLFTGIALRIVYFVINLFVGGHHIDEVMTGLNAASLADKMTDIAGEKLPVYFDTWVVGGQSPFATYLSALTVKLFGYNLFALRLPIIVFSIIGYIAFYGFIREVFEKKNERFVFLALGCISPWMLFSGTYLLDCNYIAYMIIIALYFLIRAIKENKTLLYAASMVFFGLGFYCYIASVLIIPIMLIAIYGVLILKKRITFKAVFISVLTVFIVALPFILFGLVTVGIIPEFRLLGFNFSKMPNYVRGSSLVFGTEDKLAGISAGLANLLASFLFLAIPDFEVMGIGVCIFQYTNFVGGLFMIIGIFNLVFAIRKRRKEYTFYQKLFGLASFLAIVSFCVLTVDAKMAYAYRYGVLTFMLLFLEGIGLCGFLKDIKKIDPKKVLAVFLAVSFIMFNAEFFVRYIPQVNTNSEIMYGDPVYDCLDFAKEQNAQNIVIYEDNDVYASDISVYLRDYYYPDIDRFINTDEEFIQRNIKGKSISPSSDGSIVFRKAKKKDTVKDDFVIIPQRYLKNFTYSDEYKLKDFGNMKVVYK